MLTIGAVPNSQEDTYLYRDQEGNEYLDVSCADTVIDERTVMIVDLDTPSCRRAVDRSSGSDNFAVGTGVFSFRVGEGLNQLIITLFLRDKARVFDGDHEE